MSEERGQFPGFPTYFGTYIYYATNNYLSETVIMVHRNNKELCHIQDGFSEAPAG